MGTAAGAGLALPIGVCVLTGSLACAISFFGVFNLQLPDPALGYSICPVKLIPAGDIDQAVVDQIRSIIRSPEMTAQTYFAVGQMDSAASLSRWEVIDALQQFDTIWNELYPAEQRVIVGSLVDSISVSEAGLDIRMRTHELHSILSVLGQAKEAYDERIAQ